MSGEWIPVTERLPLERPTESWETLERAVIVWDGKDVYEATYYAGSEAWDCCWGRCRWAGKDIKPTHWMSLPAPPTDAK